MTFYPDPETGIGRGCKSTAHQVPVWETVQTPDPDADAVLIAAFQLDMACMMLVVNAARLQFLHFATVLPRTTIRVDGAPQGHAEVFGIDTR